MECNINHTEPTVKFDFCCTGKKQRILIDALIKYSGLDISILTTMLHVPINSLEDVYHGRSFFSTKDADNLALLFLMFFSD